MILFNFYPGCGWLPGTNGRAWWSLADVNTQIFPPNPAGLRTRGALWPCGPVVRESFKFSILGTKSFFCRDSQFLCLVVCGISILAVVFIKHFHRYISQQNTLIGWLQIQARGRILMSQNLEIVANISPLTSVLTGILVVMTYGDHLGKVLVWLAPLFIRNNHIQIAAIDDCKSAARTSILLRNLCGEEWGGTTLRLPLFSMIFCIWQILQPHNERSLIVYYSTGSGFTRVWYRHQIVEAVSSHWH